VWLIATDEAGYGPKLGPLVITATTWHVPGAAVQDVAELHDAFEPYRRRIDVDGVAVRVDDSKTVFKPRSAISRSPVGVAKDPWGEVPPGLASLHRIASSAASLCHAPDRAFDAWLNQINPSDRSDREATPWLARPGAFGLAEDEFLGPILDVWKAADASLRRIETRVVTAKRFNRFCQEGRNKSDLLSESTLGLVKSSLDHIVADEPSAEDPIVQVFCDRHGGRRYYGGAIQHAFDLSGLRIIGESKSESRYTGSLGPHGIDVRFTVKGDSFTPVGLSSLIAKYLRERMMLAVNRYFADRHKSEIPLRPTAGYPVDADRFLQDIRQTLRRENIAADDLVRRR